ncbi:hypothetical protein B7R54_03230 [Subtercola boreus]|uniref:Phosphotyrosine protein phosphatase I domain-containing protein n=1 Tax=Subtercola boreus TaxID=120213 RepID=A0A3E0VFX3_9MICO|nr:hypothetical protein [Subtercola boreus]RFA08348.1 hypothetical protein B7R54_03230 [Subtercola boreus]TQL54749.1 protein-tyrosine phosphatase [Subtercola boreus]
MANESENRAPFRVLAVCTGNICRSPLAENLLRARFGEAGLHTVTAFSSAGLGAVVGAPMDETSLEMSHALRGQSNPAGPHTGRALSSAIVSGSDLVLTMTRHQRDDLIQRYPRALQRAFTLTEFAKLLALPESEAREVRRPDEGILHGGLSSAGVDEITGAVFRARVKDLARIRSRASLQPQDDVADPYRQARAVHEGVAHQISLAASQIAHNFAGWAAEPKSAVERSA